MASTNRVQITSVKETTIGTTPTTPRMRARNFTTDSLKWVPEFKDSETIRSDGMNSAPIKVGENSDGAINFELQYPYPDSPEAVDIASAFYNDWTDTATRDNDGTADSVVTAVATTNTEVTHTTGTAFVASQLVRFTGFGVSNNNGVFKCTTGGATTSRYVGSGITDEAAPAAAARMKVVGFVGASGDITATSTGLGSTSLDFTTLGLSVGRWIKVGGTATGDKFATSALNTWMRITAISANALTLDNRPSGWTTDSGTGKTIKVWFGDQIKNGTTQIGQTIERGFLGQTVPTYIVQPGMVANELTIDLNAKEIIKCSVSYTGMTGASQSTTSLDASPDTAVSQTTYPVMSGSANVGRVAEAGSTLTSPNWAKQLSVKINNNNTMIDAIDSIGAVAIGGHSRTVEGSMNTYFGDNTLLTKYFAGTATSINARVTKSTQAVIISLPQVTFNGEGSPNVGGMNQDLMVSVNFKASKDETYTNAMILMDRLEYFE